MLLENLDSNNPDIDYQPNDLGIEFALMTPSISFKPHPEGNRQDVLLQPVVILNDPFNRTWNTVEFDFEVLGIDGDIRYRISNDSNSNDYYFGDPKASKVVKTLGSKPSESKLLCRYSKSFSPTILANFGHDPLYNEKNMTRSGSGWRLDLVDQRGLVICSVPLPAR
jgi:hypothetical protein